jgi:glycosyltransferase involved in cell wall biosynthesis
MEQIAVSVVVPVYNAERRLGECLEDILSQTLRETEIVCVDDGSTDGSPALLEDFRRKDPRVRVIRQENRGAGTARNAGMAEARGECLCFLDADDRFEPDFLERMHDLLRQTGADVCVCGAAAFDLDPGEKRPYPAALAKRFVPAANPFDPASEEACGTVLQMTNGVPWNKLFRTAFVLETGLAFQPLRTTNDAFFVYSALCRAKKIATLDRVLVHRRTGIGNSLTRTRDLSWRCFYEALLAVRGELERCGLLGRFGRTFANRALQNAFWNMDTVSPACAEEIAELMKREGFARLGIDGHGAAYFHDARLHERYECLRGADAGAVRTVLKAWREIDALALGNRKLERAAARDAKRIASLEEARARREEKIASLKESVERRGRKIASLQKETERLRTSRAYRLGNALLSLPRLLLRRKRKA